jgi:hypothetical protein
MPRWFLTPAALLLFAVPASAQHIFESVGERALGMAGAFVAVADDATAVYWNPAGLATGQPIGATIGWHRSRFGNPDDVPRPGPWAGDSTLSTLGTWPLGVSFATLRTTAIAAAAGDTLQIESLETRHFGVTILQTVWTGVVVGSTLKYVRGSAAIGPLEGRTVGEALDRGEDLERDASGAFDLDLGVMVDMARVRAGVTIRNVREPSFGPDAETAITLPRQARIGVAVLPADGLTLAIDADLNTVDLRGDLRRMLAAGAERRLGSRAAVRAGVRWDLEGPRDPVGSVGASLALGGGMWLDGHYSQGRSGEDRQFGAALRAGY